ncbi:MAG: hypothetical protein JXR10_10310 [Cyclobacteriaceae bacterium]
MNIKQLIKWGEANPRKLFKIDGFGAILSALLLGVVLVRLESIFGIPEATLYFLASLPCLFAVYDFYCYYKFDLNPRPFLKGIAMTNFVYCCISIGAAVFHIETITYLGWIYILAEIVIVSTLAYVELRVALSPM